MSPSVVKAGKKTCWSCRSNRTNADHNHSRNDRRRGIQNVVNMMKDAPCMDCGGRFPSYVMDYDHVKGRKLYSIGYMVGRSFSLSEILAEIKKCELVCSNCHRIRTQRRRQAGG